MMVREEFAALLEMLTLPVRFPPCVGVRVIMQFAPPASVAGHVFVSVKSPLAAILASVTPAAAVFVSVTVCVLGTPTRVPLANTTLEGLAIRAGFTVIIAITEVAPVIAVRVTEVALVTPPAVIVNV